MVSTNDTPNRANLTKGRVDKFACPPGKTQSFLWDRDVTGLAVRATQAGSKSFIFQSRFGGKPIRITIGGLDAWDISKARAEARRLQTLIDQGVDPRIEKAERIKKNEERRKELQRQAVTFREVWEAYIEARMDSWGDRHLYDHRQLMQPPGIKKRRGKTPTTAGALWRFLDMRLADINDETIMAWLEVERGRRPTVAHRAYRTLRAFLNWVSETPEYSGIIQPSAILNNRVRRLVPSTGIHNDTLQKEQLATWFRAVMGIYDPVISAYLQILLLTGARRRELSPLRWDDVDFEWNSLTIRDKVVGARVIPLTPYVKSLIESLADTSPYVFHSTRSKSGHLEEPGPTHKKALQNEGLPPITLHGLRRSFGSLCEWVEIPQGVVAQIMGHRPSATAEKHYRVRPLDLLRKWHVKIEAWILAQAGVNYE
ncbi:MAG: preprotein translocase [Methylothermaceae bacteria B42]|nr:MAG: preprotein translocase [Methylothermaceae bacteria B42]HHJ39303.1 DUF4102 domain-containing protein [Methylothermaceae bacterium]